MMVGVVKCRYLKVLFLVKVIVGLPSDTKFGIEELEGCAYDPCVLGECIVDDSGNHTCLCDKGVTGTACNILNENASASCSFEDGSHCFMTNSESDHFDWTIETTYTETDFSGPTFAHGGSKYLYIESSYPQRKGFTADFISYVDLRGPKYCFSMWYHMYGSDIGSLIVQTANKTLWSKSGNQSNTWKEIYIDVAMTSKQQLSIIGEVGGDKGDIAIDDLKLIPGSCGCLSVVCSNGGTCIENNGTAVCKCPLNYSGAKCQNSVCAINDCDLGTCIPNNVSSYLCDCQPGVMGILCDTIMDTKNVSCTFEPGEPCFLQNRVDPTNFNWTVHFGTTETIYSGIYGPHGGRYFSFMKAYDHRSLYTRAVLFSSKFAPANRCLNFWYHKFATSTGQLIVSVSGRSIFNITDNQRSDWNEVYVDFPDPHTTVIMLEFIAFPGRYYQGDIALDDVSVSVGLCGCKTNPCVHGQCVDDFSSKNGYNCTCDLGFVGINCETNVCQTNLCVEGADCVPDMNSTIGYKCVCKPGYSGDNCKPNACKYNHCYRGQCIVTGSDSYSCRCDKHFVGVLCNTAGRNATLTCDFEPDSFCFLSNVVDDVFDWTIQKGKTKSYGTGPDKAIQGQYYAYAETSHPRLQDDWATLASTDFTLQDGPRCLTFRYHMFGSSMGTLEVLGNDKVKWSISNDQREVWHDKKVDINSKTVSFKAIRGRSYRGDIAIDDVKLLPGYCR